MKNKYLIFAIFMYVLFISGCNSNEKVTGGNTKDELLIITSFYPVYISTINITHDIQGVKVVNLTEPFTGCLHDYALTADDMKNMASADIFVINGAGMESFLDKITDQMPGLKVVDSSKGIEVIKHGEEDNPHIWLSVSGLIKQIDNIEKGLSLYDPSHKELYRKNADMYRDRLNKLKNDMTDGLKDVKDRNIITFHEAFPYFGKEFNLNIVAVIEREPGSEPNAKELAETIQIVKNQKVKALFAEPQYPKNSADVISKETGVNLYTLDPAVTGPFERDAYINIMNSNLKILQKALK
ncbi:MAG: metal ABC transporter substrate-binding protein [Candidatus Eremiobacterota bacterium]